MALGEWDRRELCPDGGCVGVIGADGHCKVCKRAVTNWGNERERGLKDDPEADADDAEDEDEDDELEDETAGEDDDDDGEDDDDDDGDEDGDDDEADDDDDDDDGDEDDDDDGVMDAIHPSAPAAIGAAGAWNERQLCPDGGCIGLLGEDGLCKVCGKGKKRAVKAGAPATMPSAVAAPAPAASAAPAKTSEADSKEDSEDDSEEDSEEDSEDDSQSSEDAELEAAADDLAASLVEDRKLCPDGACVGVIGSDGTCKLCGKEAG